MTPVAWQRIENGLIAGAILYVAIVGGVWGWILGLFLAFDVSMVGYLRGPRLGALIYNAVHSYIAPVALGCAYLLTDVRWAGILGLAWAFHIALDRASGYGLKLNDAFAHTHLGTIGKKRA